MSNQSTFKRSVLSIVVSSTIMGGLIVFYQAQNADQSVVDNKGKMILFKPSQVTLQTSDFSQIQQTLSVPMEL